MRPCRMNSLIPLLALLLAITAATATGQLLPENLKLSQTRLQPVVPPSVRIQAVAGNDGVDLVVWGSSMREGDRAHPVLYFAILQDSAILIPPTRLTGLESFPNTFVQVLPLSGRWGVIWTNDTGANARSRCVVVSPDGSLGGQFELWEGHPITRHGAQAVRMGSADFICWSDTGEVEVVGRWLPHEANLPDPMILVDSGYLYLTRDYCSNINGGLIETSVGNFHLVKDDRSQTRLQMPALDKSYDVYTVDDSCSLYVAREDTVSRYVSILDEEPETTNRIEVESWLDTAPITCIQVDERLGVSVSTLAEPDIDHAHDIGIVFVYVDELRYFLDVDLEVIGDTTFPVGGIYLLGRHTSRNRLGAPSGCTMRLPDNGGRWLVSVRQTFQDSEGEIVYNIPILFGGHEAVYEHEITERVYRIPVLYNPTTVLKRSMLKRGTGNNPIVAFEGGKRPSLSSGAASFALSATDRIPSFSVIGTRVFSSWYSLAHDTLLATVEILRDSNGNAAPGDIQYFPDSTGLYRGRDIVFRALHSVGPVSIREMRWKSGSTTFVEVSSLQLQEGAPEWVPFYRDSLQGRGGVMMVRFYYDPDDRLAWIIASQGLHYEIAGPFNTRESRTGFVDAHAARISDSGLLRDVIALVEPVSSGPNPVDLEKVIYIPINTDEYVLGARPALWRVEKGRVVDSLTVSIGETGAVAPFFNDIILERTSKGGAVGMSYSDPKADTLKDLGLYTVPGGGVVESQTLVRPDDSAGVLLFRWNSGVRTQTHDRTSNWYTVQDVSAGNIDAYNPSGVFTGDTLWTVFEVKSGESYQIYLNAVIPDDGIAGVPVVAGEPSEGFAVEQSEGRLFVRAPGSFESGYVVDILGRVVVTLDEGQRRGEEAIDMSVLPAGSYLVVLCAEECVARRVGMW